MEGMIKIEDNWTLILFYLLLLLLIFWVFETGDAILNNKQAWVG